jgi:hypothetical protein
MNLRVSDDEREIFTERLASGLADGRLDLPEFERRLNLMSEATTRSDLELVVADLPPSRRERDQVAADKRQSDAREWRKEWGYWLGGALVMTTIWAVNSVRDGEFAFYWPLAPLGIWAAILLAELLWSSDKDE